MAQPRILVPTFVQGQKVQDPRLRIPRHCEPLRHYLCIQHRELTQRQRQQRLKRTLHKTRETSILESKTVSPDISKLPYTPEIRVQIKPFCVLLGIKHLQLKQRLVNRVQRTNLQSILSLPAEVNRSLQRVVPMII